MKVLFWMFIGFDRPATSHHLLLADVEQLLKLGHEVHILQKDTGGPLPALPERLKGYPVATHAVAFQAADKRNFAARYCSELRYIRACQRWIVPGYDAVFIQSNNLAGFALRAVRRRLPRAIVTFNVQDIFPENAALVGSLRRNGLLFRALAAVQKSGYRKSDHIVTISQDMKETLIAAGAPRERIEVVYNWSYRDEPYRGVDTTAVSHLFDPDAFNVVYAGNIGLMQNVELLLEAADILKGDGGIRFHIIGNGVRREKLENEARRRNLQYVSFHAMLPAELAPALYSAADVNVIPLAKNLYTAALPSKTATCLACPAPIVFAIGRSGRFARRMAEEPGCLVVDSDDARALADAIEKVRSGAAGTPTGRFFAEHCAVTKNSRRLARIVVSPPDAAASEE